MFHRIALLAVAALAPICAAESVSLLLEGQRFLNQGRYAESEAAFRRAVPLLQHRPDLLAVAYNNLAQVCKHTRRYAEADPLYRRALELLRPTSAAAALRHAQVQLNLADLFRVQQKLVAAERLYREALTTLRAQLDEDHPDVQAASRGLRDVITHNGWRTGLLLDARQPH